MKTEFYCNRLVGDATRSLESSSMHWQARTIDLGTPFIKDDNRDVRRQISQTVLNVITVIAAAMDRAPTIARKRDESSVANKLRKVYDRLSRTRTVFPRTGPRSSAVLSQPPIRSVVRDREQPTALSAQSSTADLYGGGVPSATWDDGHWSDEFEAADEQRLHPEPFVESPASEEQQEAFAPPLIPDPKAEEEREAEKQMRLEKLKAKREAREAELRLKRERKKSLVTSIKTECSASAVTCDSNHTDCALSNETNQAESPLDTSSPAPLEQSLSVIVGVPLTKSKDPELAEEMDYFRDMEPAIPAPTLLVLEHLADMHSKASQEASPALGQSPQPNISTPPLLTPTSSRLAMLEVVTDDVVGSGWGHDGLSDFDD
ncbi:hypothetical protein DFJ77DRAFT_52575 [Powellomyces hirtus]|nr:hypothetical protein DFJ77DRAFT_52575 [Powellomyces hirtus]